MLTRIIGLTIGLVSDYVYSDIRPGLYLNIVASPITNISQPKLQTPNVGGINVI